MPIINEDWSENSIKYRCGVYLILDARENGDFRFKVGMISKNTLYNRLYGIIHDGVLSDRAWCPVFAQTENYGETRKLETALINALSNVYSHTYNPHAKRWEAPSECFNKETFIAKGEGDFKDVYNGFIKVIESNYPNIKLHFFNKTLPFMGIFD